MTTEPTDTHSPTPATEPLALKFNEGLGPPVPEWEPTLEFSERAIDRFVYSQEPAGEMAEEFRADLAAVIAEAVAEANAKWRAACENIARDLRNHDMVRLGAAKCLDAGLRA